MQRVVHRFVADAVHFPTAISKTREIQDIPETRDIPSDREMREMRATQDTRANDFPKEIWLQTFKLVRRLSHQSPHRERSMADFPGRSIHHDLCSKGVSDLASPGSCSALSRSFLSVGVKL